MQHACAQCRQSFEVTDDDLAFYDGVSPIIGEKKYEIPFPTRCPDCRFQMRLLFRNDRHLYHRKSSLSRRQIVSIYSAEQPFPVYDQDEWWSDQWNAQEYAQEVNFNRPFCDQLQELRLRVPRISLFNVGCENSYYTNHALFQKNCYLIFGGGNNEDCLFSNYVSFSKDVLDGLCLYSCERCYEGVASQRCYNCIHFMNCRDCTDCVFVEDCLSCSNCTACFGLHRKEYCILNREVGKNAYEDYRQQLFPMTHVKLEALQREFAMLRATLPHRGSHMYGSEDCTGDAIYNSKHCINCFDVADCEDSKNLAFTPKGIRSHDATFTSPDGVEGCYQVASTVGAPYSMAIFLVWYGSHIFYSIECHNCSDCFGCVGLRNCRHCILNKQYRTEEYEGLAAKIIEHMRKTGEYGEFFPPTMCPYGYNETNANDYFPLTREQALAKGWQWREDTEAQTYFGPPADVPEDISEVDDGICDRILVCEVTGKPFKVIPQELKFYREMGLPVPMRCFDQRHRDRLARRCPRKLWPRTCAKCGEPMQTTYSPDRLETVYCERCYLETVY